MQIRSFECVRDQDDWRAASIRQQFCHRTRRLRAAILTLVGGLLCIPFILIATDQRAMQHALDLMIGAPVAALQLLTLLVIGIAALACGVGLMSRSAVHERDIAIRLSDIFVQERMGRSSRTWSEPLQAYHGIRHRVITTSGGPTHTLVLEHERQDRSLIIANEPHLPDRVIAAASQELGLPVLTGNRRQTSEISRSLNFVWPALMMRRTHFEQNVGT